MSDSQRDDRRTSNTLRGFLTGEPTNEELYFAYSATLRIFGKIPSIEQLTVELGLEPTSYHRTGERRGPKSPPYEHDMWSFSPSLPENRPLSEHIDSLWQSIKPKATYLKHLKHTLTVDVFLGYRSNCDHAGIEVPHTCLEMFTELEIPFGLSVIIA